jgi:hypothetical protein
VLLFRYIVYSRVWSGLDDVLALSIQRIKQGTKNAKNAILFPFDEFYLWKGRKRFIFQKLKQSMQQSLHK